MVTLREAIEGMQEQGTPESQAWDSLERAEKIEILRERMLAYRRVLDGIEDFFRWGGRLGILEGGIEYALRENKRREYECHKEVGEKANKESGRD